MKFRKILSAVLACSLAVNLLTGSILANAATGNAKTTTKASTSSNTPKASVPTTATIACETCQDILQCRDTLYKIAENLLKDSENKELLDKQADCQKKLVSLLNLNHECNEKTIYVECYRYVLHDFYGYYTGYWKGASPSGKGKFTADYLKNTSTFDPDTQITTKTYKTYTYEGDWVNGYGNGKGEYILENYTTETPKSTGKETFKKSTGKERISTSYQGEIKDQKRNGKGSEKWVYSDGHYFILDEGTYKNGVLQETVAFKLYNKSDELTSVGTIKYDKDAKKHTIVSEEKVKEKVTTTEPATESVKETVTEPVDEESKRLRNALIVGVAGAAVVGGAMLIDNWLFGNSSYYDYEYETEEPTMSAEEANNRYWADYHAKKEEERKKEAEEAAENARKQQEYLDNNYYYYKKTYGDDDARTQKWKKWSGN